MILTPNTIMPMTALNFLGPDGKCFTFDARANGYGRGEGIGVVVMKRLSDAIRDNDTIRAVIRGTRVNQDGRTTGITLPSKEAQVANIRGLYKSTGLDYNQTAFVECHGTGTQAGDWRELKAISETIGSERDVENPVVVGSIKPNIGHLEGAAGVAGLIKGVIVLERGKIPPNINFETPNPDIDFENWKVKVPQKLLEWPLTGTRRASVNCFGFGGTNAHVILDEAPAYLRERGLTANHMSLDTTDSRPATNGFHNDNQQPHLFCFSSNEKTGVHRILESQIPYVESATDPDFLENYSYTLNSRRSNMEWKTTIVASSTTELVAKMKSIDTDAIVRSSSDSSKAPRICFVFCGQGAQWAKMGESLMCFNVFRESLEAASDYIKSKLGSPFALLDELFKAEEESRISEPAIAQPATTALQVALVELFRSLGIHPSQVIGHSSGEIAAAFAANALSREAAWDVAYYRGLHASALPLKNTEYSGGMMAVGMSESEARKYLSTVGSQLDIACINSPRSVTLSGEAKSIETIASDLKETEIFHRVLPVSTAYHSQHMGLVADDYLQSLAHLTPESTDGVTMYSSVTGQKITDPSLDGQYWVANMVSPVQFQQAVEQMMASSSTERPNIILELSPRGILKGPTSDVFKAMGIKSAPNYLSTLESKSAGPVPTLKVIGELWARGQSVNMHKLVSRGSSTKRLKCLTNMPPYPWNHTKTYWHEGHLGKAFRFRKYPRQDLIGAQTADSISLEPRWRGFLRISENPWIEDHQVQKTTVYPAAGMICMVLEGAKQLADEQSNLIGYHISNMRIEKPMLIPATEHGLEMALNIKLHAESLADGRLAGSHEFAIYSKQFDAPWERNATGNLQFQYDDSEPLVSCDSTELQRQTRRQTRFASVNPRQLYELLETVGMNYGPLFQNITELSQGGDSCLTTIRVPNTKSKMPANFEYPHLIHPATLDSMFQTLFSIESTPMVPTLIESITVPSILGQTKPDHYKGFSTARRVESGARADISMALGGNEVHCIDIKGLHLTSLAQSSLDSGFLPNHRNLCTEIIWDEDVAFANPKTVADFIGLLAYKHPALTVLQVGGTTSLTLNILEVLTSNGTKTPKLAKLTVAKADGGASALPLNVLNDSPLRSYVEETDINSLSNSSDYHLILVCRNSGISLDTLSKHRKTEGYTIECDNLKDANFTSDAKSRDSQQWPFSRSVTEHSINPSTGATHPDEVVFLYEDESPSEVRTFALKFANDGYVRKDHDPMVSILTLSHACKDASLFEGKVIISLLDFKTSRSSGFVYHWTEEQFEAFRVVQKAALGIIWITKTANMQPKDPKLSPVVALGRTLMSEDRQKIFITVDLAADTHLSHDYVSSLARQIYARTFQEPGSSPVETEYAVMDGKVYISRLTTLDGLNQLIENGIADDHGKFGPPVPFDSTQRLFMGLILKLEVAKPGFGHDSMRFIEQSCRVLEPDEVEIRFDRTILDHSDLKAILAGSSSLGLNFFGRITRFGRNVRGFRPGAEVVALVPQGTLQSSVIVNSALVAPAQPGFVPSLYLDAFYGLFRLGYLDLDMARGRVLVLSGMSQRGLAAITLCQLSGHHVYTTIMGDDAEEQKAEIIRLTNLPVERVLVVTPDSLANKAKYVTGGRGFQLVYNPTGHHHGPDSQCVRPSGVLVRASDASRDPVREDTTTRIGVSTYNFAEMIQDEVDGREILENHLAKVMKLLEKKDPNVKLPATCPKKFSVSNIAGAFHHIQNGGPMTTAVISLDGNNNSVRVYDPAKDKTFQGSIDPEGIYILAGGLGGLGRSIAEHLFDNGARTFAFVSRSGASSKQAQDFVVSLTSRGAQVIVFAVSLTDKQGMLGAIQSCLSTDGQWKQKRISGVFQCAAVIQDAVFENMGWKDWQTAFRPKSLGSLNLVDTILELGQHPFFIFLASSAGVIGNRSQANYAAGNGFEDAMARKLRASGEHAVAIDLGPVLGAGMLAEDEKTLDILKNNGFYGIRHEDFIKVVEQAIINKPSLTKEDTFPAQITLGVGTGGLMLQNQPADPYWSRTALWSHLHLVDMPLPNLATSSAGSEKDMKAHLASATDFDTAKKIVCTGLMHMLAKAMNMLFEEMDEHKPPTSYGVDSLVAVGVRNWVFTNCGVNVSVFEVLSDKTVGELSEVIAERSGFGE